MMHLSSTTTRRRRRAALFCLLAVVAACGLHGELLLPSFWEDGPSIDDDSGDSSSEADADTAHRRSLLANLESRWTGAGAEHDLAGDFDAAFAAASGDDDKQQPPQPRTFAPYTLEDALNERAAFAATFAVLIYHPPKDKFIALFAKEHKWIHSVDTRLLPSITHLSFFLRNAFPERFRGATSDELAIAVSAGDFPHVDPSKLPHSGKAPMLQFGSAFRDPGVYENMLAMPMPERHHLHCFQEYVARGTVCKKLRPNPYGGGEMVFGDEFRLFWDDLIPQLVWRGTDFGYLPRLAPTLIKPYGYKAQEGESGSKEAAVRELRLRYDSLLPRWKAMLLTAESELEAAQSQRDLPWANMKFATAGLKTSQNNLRYLDNGRAYPVRRDAKAKDVVNLSDVGLAPGGFMSHPETAKYKYHIDLGGGGGTTWTGTLQKLAMPGLLFHHVTPTKDYLHDLLVPWRHYVPVSHDLTDLRAKFEWAEANPEKARQIADQATDFMRQLTTKEGYGAMVEQVLIEPLRRIIEAYQPLSTTSPGTSWVEYLEQSPLGKKMVPVVECIGGKATRGSCRGLGGDAVTQWAKTRGQHPGGPDEFSCPSCSD